MSEVIQERSEKEMADFNTRVHTIEDIEKGESDAVVCVLK